MSGFHSNPLGEFFFYFIDNNSSLPRSVVKSIYEKKILTISSLVKKHIFLMWKRIERQIKTNIFTNRYDAMNQILFWSVSVLELRMQKNEKYCN